MNTPASLPGEPSLGLNGGATITRIRVFLSNGRRGIALLLALAAASSSSGASAEGLGSVSANATQLKAMSAQVLFPSDPATLWSVTDDPQWICSLLPGCVEVVKTSGSGEAYTATVNLSGSGVSLPSGLSQLKVAISVSDRIPGQSLNVKMTTSNALGRFTTTAAIALQDRGDNSSVTYKTTSASGTGVVGQLAVRNLSGSIKTQLGSSSENFATRMERQQSVALAVKPLAVLPNGRTQVRTTILVDFPDFLEAPSVNGRVRIWSKNRIICSKAIVDSQATCSLSVSRKKIANLLVTTSGTLSTGTDFSLGSTLRLRPTRNGR